MDSSGECWIPVPLPPPIGEVKAPFADLPLAIVNLRIVPVKPEAVPVRYQVRKFVISASQMFFEPDNLSHTLCPRPFN
jgi:hypothetical protein